MDKIASLAGEVKAADHVVALTGAGVSTASGIPDFRSEGGIWDQFDPSEFHYSRFQADPAGFWELRVQMHEAVYGGDIAPNDAHTALAMMEAEGVLDAVITQNIDGLHRDAGSEEVIELHGNGQRVVCQSCGRRQPMAAVRDRINAGELPPYCEACEGVLKPDVILFGEPLPQAPLQQAQQHAQQADVFLAIGSSLSLQPAASLPSVAQRAGGTLAIFNLESTPLSSRATYDFRADVTETLPALVDSL